MANKTIAIVDINNFHKQNIETLLFACILEKKVNKLSILDLNTFGQEKIMPKKECWTKDGEILSTKIFSNASYQMLSKTQPDQNKLLNLAKSLKARNNILLLNVNNQQHNLNSPFYCLADEIVVFADLEKDITKDIINFYLHHDLKGKKILLFVHNYKQNIQDEKTYFQLLKRFSSPNVAIHKIDNVPNFNSLSDIEQIDPWLEIYKKINML